MTELRPVSDPALLEQLNASPAPAAPPSGLKPVTDTVLLAQLMGAPAPRPETIPTSEVPPPASLADAPFKPVESASVADVPAPGVAAPALATVEPTAFAPPQGAVAPTEQSPLPFPDQPESTVAETAGKFVENVPAMFKRSGAGLMQAFGETNPDVDPAFVPGGTAGLVFSGAQEDPQMAEVRDLIREARDAPPIISDLGREIFARATLDLMENAPNIDPNSAKGWGYDIALALTQMAPAVGVSLLTKSPNLGLSVLGGQVYGDRYGESREAGRTVAQAHQDATFYALAEVIPERIPMGILMKRGTKFLPRVVGATVAEGVQEVFTSILQTGYDMGVLNEEMTWGEAWNQVKREGLIGAAVGGHLAVITHPFVRGEPQQAAPQPEQPAQPDQPAPTGSPRGAVEDILNDERTADELREADAAAAREQEQAAQQAEAEAAARAREQYGLPEDGTTVTVTDPEGNSFTGALEEVFEIDGTAQARVVTDQGDAVEFFLDDVAVTKGSGVQADPVQAETPADVETAAAQAEPDPSPAQKEAGNYAKGHIKLQGLDITIENAKGSERSGIGSDGVPWSVTMPATYGYIKRTEGADGDHVDVYVGETPSSDLVVVVDQIDPATGQFDEHKVMMGFTDTPVEIDLGTTPEWLAKYWEGFSDGSGPQRTGGFALMTMAQFKEWLANGDTTKPVDPRSKESETRAPGPAVPVEREEPPAAEPPSPEQPGAGVSRETQPDLLGGAEIATEDAARQETAARLVRESRDEGMSDQEILDALTEVEEGASTTDLPADAGSTLFQDESLIAPMREIIARDQREVERRNRLAQERPEPTQTAPAVEPTPGRTVQPLTEDEARAEATRLLAEGKDTAGSSRTEDGRGFTWSADQPVTPKAPRNAKGRIQIADDRGNIYSFTKASLRRETAKAESKQPTPAEVLKTQIEPIGQNAAREDIFEDPKGVRYVRKDGIRITEPVRIVPTREGVATGVDRTEGRNERFRTTEEAAPGTPARIDPNAFPPSSVVAQARDMDGTLIGYFAEPHDGTPEGKRQANTRLRARLADVSANWSNVNTRTGITDASGNAVEVISPNGRNIAPASSEGARYIFGETEITTERTPPPSQSAPESAISKGEESTDATLRQIRRDRQGPPEEAPAADVRGPAGERPVEPVSDQPERTDRRHGDDRPARDTGQEPAADGLPETPPATRVGAAERGGDRAERPAVQRPADRKPAERIRGANYRIESGESYETGPKARAQGNLNAIKLLKELEADGRVPTLADQKVLAQYVGWGGLVQAFPKPSGEFTKGWADVGKELREILTDEEFESARASTPNAHFTSLDVVRAMWRFAEESGFHHGSVLEPGMGVGYFLGTAPGTAGLHGVELDNITGRLARQLYPEGDIRVEGFQDAHFPENHFDLVIGNVPFADVRPFDPKYNKGKFSLHDYYFVKSLALTRPGGYVMFITSRFTMDKKAARVRRAIAKQADLVGAIRLPNTAFKGIANTEVTTDIIVLRKRRQGEEAAGPDWMEVKPFGPENIPINEYFIERPRMMAGEMALTGTQYGANEPTLEPGDVPLAQALPDIFVRLHEDARSSGLTLDPEKPDSPADRIAEAESIEAPDTVKEGAYFVEDGLLYRKQFGRGAPTRIRSGRGSEGINKTDYDRLVRLAGIRDAAREVLRTQMLDLSQQQQDAARKTLGRLYDAFVKKHGPVNLTRISESKRADGKVIERRLTPNLRLFQEDPDGMLVAALEIYDVETGKAQKAPMFTERVLAPEREIKQVDTPEDALLASLNKHNRVDLDYIAGLYGGTPASMAETLRGQIYRDPASGEYVTADAYLAGDVRRKLAEAEQAAAGDEAFTPNVEALRQVQPEDLPPSQIEARLGAPWIPKEDIAQFTAELLGGDPSQVEISHHARDAEWVIAAPGLKYAVAARSDWGTDAVDAISLIGHGLNMRQPTVTRTFYEDGKKVERKDVDATLAAQDKLQKIKDRFRAWIWEDAARGDRLARFYNDRFNTIRLRAYDGSHLTFSGMKEIVPGGWFQGLRAHQKNGVWRIMQAGNTLLGHVVGGGKTMTMVAAGMEMKRVGLISKPMYVVPNHMLDQFSRELLQLYPAAQIMVADEQQFHTSRRKLFVNRIATGNWDAIIITHSAFGKIPISPEFEIQFLKQTIAEYRSLEEEARQEGDRNLTKKIEKQKQRWEARLEALASRHRKDTGVTFEETGIDFLFVDEAHEFKNLETRTKIQNVKNLNTQGSQKSFDVLMKLRYLDGLNPGRAAVFSTATPVSNSMVEMYTVQRYLQPRMLQSRGLEHFDAWAGQFGEVVTALELDPTGAGYRIDSRFAKFVNVPELLQMYREIADIQTAEMLNLPTPRLKGGKAQVIEAKASPDQVAAVETLKRRLEQVKGKRPEKGADNPLKVVTDGRHIALDMRTRDAGAEDFADSKVNKAVDRIHETWRDTAKAKLTQLVFIDLSSPIGEGFSVYRDMRDKLIAKGVPEKQVVFIHGANTAQKKARLFEDVRAGKVRILFGSTAKMGIGTNVQERLVALHHIDAPWRPADVEQRDGRILRQGNTNEEISIFRYVTSGTFDAYMWQTLETKHKFIQQVMTGDLTVREMEDLNNDSSLLDPATVKAIASGNPLILEKAGVDADIVKLTRLEAEHRDQQFRFRRAVAALPEQIESRRHQVESLRKDIERRSDTRGNAFRMAVGSNKLTKRNKAGEALATAVQSAAAQIANSGDVPGRGQGAKTVGQIGGFDVDVIVQGADDVRLALRGELAYGVEIDLSSPLGMVQRLENALAGLNGRLDTAQETLAADERELKDMQERIGQPFEHAERIAALQTRAKEIEEALTPKRDQAQPASETPQTAPDETERLSRAERTTTPPADQAGFSLDERRRQVEAALRAELDAMGLGDIALKVREKIEAEVDGRLSAAQGRFIRGLIEISLQAKDTGVTLNHEAVHAMRDLDLFSDAEWAALVRKSKAWRQDYRIDTRYKDQPEWVRIEEAIAHAYGDWATGKTGKTGKRRTGGLMLRAFNKIRRLLERIGNALRGLGFRAAEDVFAAMRSGEVGGRPRHPGFAREAKATFGDDIDAAAFQRAVVRDRKAMFSLIEDSDSSIEARPAEGGISIEERGDSGDLGIVKRFLYTPEKAFKRWPKLAQLQEFGVQVEMRMSEFITRLMHDYNAIRARLSRDQYEKLADILFVGDAEQTEFSPEQLAELGADRSTAAAYRDIRSLFEKVGRFVDQHRRAMLPQVRRRKLSILRRMSRIRDMDSAEFRRLYAERTRLRRALRLGEGSPQETTRRLEAIEADLGAIREQTDEYQALAAELDRLDAVLAQTSIRRRTGYVPHKFFGSWAIYEVETGPDGEESHTLVSGENGFHPDRDSAVKAAKAHLAERPDANLVVRPVQFQFPSSEATALTDASYWRFMQNASEALQLQGEDLREAVRGVARRKFRRRIAGFARFRKGVQGYSKDFDRVMIAHIAEAVRYVMLDKLKYRAINTLERMGLSPYRSANLERGTLQEAINAWLRDVNGQKQPIEAQLDEILQRPWAKPLRVAMLGGTAVASLTTFGVSANPLVGGLLGSYVGYRLYRALKDGGAFKTRALTGAMLGDMAHAKLGMIFNVYSAVVNLSQTAINTFPVLKGYTMTGMKMLFAASSSRFAGKPNRHWRLLERADIATRYRYGDQPTHQFTRESRLAGASLFLFNHAEMFNRAVSFLGGYQRAIDRGATEAQAVDAATRVMRRTQFHYGNANKPEVLRSVLLRVPLQFKNFMLQQISFIAGLNRKEIPLFLVSLFLMAGMLGFPGMDLLEAILDLWADFSPTDELKKQALEMQAQGELEGAAGNLLARGLPALIGDDLSVRIGVGEKFLPTAARDYWGPWVSSAQGAMRLGELNATVADHMRNLVPGIGKPLKSLEAAANGLPIGTLATEPGKFYEALADGKIAYTNPYQGGALEFDERILGPGDLVRLGLGGAPLQVSQIRDVQGIRARETEKLDRKRKRYLNQIVNAYRLYGAGDDADREKLVTVLGRVSTRAADDGVIITKQHVDNALKRATEPRILRMVQQTRRELRPEIWGLVKSAAPGLAEPKSEVTK